MLDHSAWGRFLSRYLVSSPDGINRLRYGAVDARARSNLDSYIDAMASVSLDTYRRDEQLAYWINLYNALTVKVVLDHYPVVSIKDISISPGLFTRGPWGRKLVTVLGLRLSLDDIEHRILRPLWRDPRIHYAVNCASIGCPNLATEPYTGAAIEPMLDTAARQYVNHPRGARVEAGLLHVSSIYRWYRDDFGASDAEVIGHLSTYAGPALREALAGIAGIHADDYDWSLNAALPDDGANQ